MIELRKAGGQFSAARPWTGNDDQWSGDFDELIGSIALIAYHGINISRITTGETVGINLYSLPLQPVSKDSD